MVKTNRPEMEKKTKMYFDPWESIFEGNPAKILERGEKVTLPPLLIMQGGLMGVFASIDVFFFYFFHELALIPTFIMMSMKLESAPWKLRRQPAASWKRRASVRPASSSTSCA